MNVAKTLEQGLISSAVDVLGHGSIFPRIIAEIERNNAAMPSATGTEKRAKVLKDFEIIFDDLAVPVGKRMLSILLDMAVGWLESQVAA